MKLDLSTVWPVVAFAGGAGLTRLDDRRNRKRETSDRQAAFERATLLELQDTMPAFQRTVSRSVASPATNGGDRQAATTYSETRSRLVVLASRVRDSAIRSEVQRVLDDGSNLVVAANHDTLPDVTIADLVNYLGSVDAATARIGERLRTVL